MTASEQLRALARDYWEGVLERNPTLATFFGDHRFDDRLPDVGPAGRAAEERALRDVFGRLHTMDQSPLETQDHITRDMLRLQLETSLDGLRLRLDELGVDQMQGPQVWLAELLNWHPTDSPEGLRTLEARYRAFPTFMDQYLEALEDGVRDGRTAPRIAVERVLGQLDSLLGSTPEQSPWAQPVARMDSPEGEALVAAVREALYPAYHRMRDSLRTYLERHARQEPGVWAVRDGAEIYQLACRQHTTTDLTPDELHQVGLDELRGIQAEMRAIMERQGDSNGDIRAFTARLTTTPSNLPSSREQMVAEAEAYLARAYGELPRLFGRLPNTPCVVKPIEEYREKDAVAAFYYPPTEDGSRPGIFYLNTFEPSSRPRHTLPALVFHEGVPGHHLQIALAIEERDLPAFRRLSAGWLANAYVEGWALYTERLADEIGLYPDDLARFGMLGYQAWRACRLVVDTGLHHLRWGRQQAIDFFFDNVGLTERETVNEVDRYIIWPGQALSYKIGHREIARLRAEAEQSLGERCDLAAFHDEILRYGGVPLSTLGSIVRDWVRQQGS